MDMDYSWPAKIGNKNIHLCPLTNDKDREAGFQHIQQGPGDEEGLLFVFNDESPRHFHMKNVGFDLDLLGFNNEGRLVFVLPMIAGTPTTYKTLPCKFAVETKKGWGLDLPIGAAKLSLEQPLQEAVVAHSVMGSMEGDHEHGPDSPVNFVNLGWLDLDRDGLMDIYQMYWDRFDPTDIKANNEFKIEEEEVIGNLVKNKRDQYNNRKK